MKSQLFQSSQAKHLFQCRNRDFLLLVFVFYREFPRGTLPYTSKLGFFACLHKFHLKNGGKRRESSKSRIFSHILMYLKNTQTSTAPLSLPHESLVWFERTFLHYEVQPQRFPGSYSKFPENVGGKWANVLNASCIYSRGFSWISGEHRDSNWKVVRPAAQRRISRSSAGTAQTSARGSLPRLLWFVVYEGGNGSFASVNVILMRMCECI